MTEWNSPVSWLVTETETTFSEKEINIELPKIVISIGEEGIIPPLGNPRREPAFDTNAVEAIKARARDKRIFFIVLYF